jgi:hypothetical protein
MALYNEPNLTAGVDDALISIGSSVPSFPIMMLVFVYFLILAGGSTSQKRRIGTADIPFWNVLAALSTMMVALLMTIGDGIINLTTLSVVVGITVLSGVWFYLSKVRGEV